ncbi:hypothetical protein LshimejAT787_0107210 [Lyophyllum shimeji]|uniref:Uncharacterized protein n=1 Tax=Lyophyllum shimeji TaxID=47721 RepID=A0A9P3UI79_LYOSH|nr:hypothetical protein LshimejAT787_0107210 [Lyophyllum shimeji]
MSDSEVAPPPYSEQEFDQKITQALAVSAQRAQDPADQGGWEEWSDAAFAAAEARLRAQNNDPSSHHAGSSSQSPPGQEYHATPLQALGEVAPLKIQKRAKSGGTSTASKPRPSWLFEAEFKGSAGKPTPSSSSHRAAESPNPAELRPWEVAQTHREIPQDDEGEDRSIPPPPFASMGPPMDGISRLEYHPESTPPSPLTSPLPDHHLPPHPGCPPLQPDHPIQPRPLPQVHVESYGQPNNGPLDDFPHAYRPPRQSLPTPPRPADYHVEQRPLSTLGPRQVHGIPRMDFNPSKTPPRSPDHLRPRTVSTISSPVQSSSRLEFAPSGAYNKTGAQSFVPHQPSQPFNPTALYNAAVSAQLSTMSMQPKESRSSRHQRPSHTTYSHATAQHTPLRLGDHGSSHMSSMGPSPSGAMNWSTPVIQSTYPAQNPANVPHFTQYSSYPTTYIGPTTHRWATSEQQLNQNFQ